jgi:hypothetical protein
LCPFSPFPRAQPGLAVDLFDYGATADCYTLVLRRGAVSARAWRASHGAHPPLGCARLYAAVYGACLECVAGAAAAGVLHLDIKADNFLLRPREGPACVAPQALWAPRACPGAGEPLSFEVLLADFGSASLRAAAGTCRHAGSECVKAPEMLRAGARAAGAGSAAAPPGCGAPADVWAAGCLAHELFCGAPLFGDAEREWVRFFVLLTAPGGDVLPAEAAGALEAVHPQLRAFVSGVLCRQPAARPSAVAVVKRFAKLREKLERDLPPYAPPDAQLPRDAEATMRACATQQALALRGAHAPAGQSEAEAELEQEDSAAAADADAQDAAAVAVPLCVSPAVEVSPGLCVAPLQALAGGGFTHALRCVWGRPGAHAVAASSAAEAAAAAPQQRRRSALLAAAKRGDPWNEAGAALVGTNGATRVAAWTMPHGGVGAAGATACCAALDAGVALLAAALLRGSAAASSSSTGSAAAAAAAQLPARVLLAPSPGCEAAAAALAAAWVAMAASPPPHGALGALRAVVVLAPGVAPDAAARAGLAAWADVTLVAPKPRAPAEAPAEQPA